jgi:hypothetical protein
MACTHHNPCSRREQSQTDRGAVPRTTVSLQPTELVNQATTTKANTLGSVHWLATIIFYYFCHGDSKALLQLINLAEERKTD